MRKIKRFTFEGRTQEVVFTETEKLPPDVLVHLYKFAWDDTKDLALFTTKKRTPLQRVRQGTRTVEGYISGQAKLTIAKPDGTTRVYEVGKDTGQLSVDVEIGDLMRWEVLNGSTFVGYEVCFPPWAPGRYEDVEY